MYQATEMIAFQTPKGVFFYQVMPFGLKMPKRHNRGPDSFFQETHDSFFQETLGDIVELTLTGRTLQETFPLKV